MFIYFITLAANSIQYKDNSNKLLEVLDGNKIINFHTKNSIIDDDLIEHKWHKKRYGFNLSVSEIQLIATHLEVWKCFYNSNEEWCMVVDNSVQFECSPNFYELETDLKKVKWDIFFPFEENDIYGIEDPLANKVILNSNIREAQTRESYLIGKRWGDSIYLINKRGVQKLLNIERWTQNIDDEILMQLVENRLDVYCKTVNWFNRIKQQVIVNLDREHEIYKAISSVKVWEKKSMGEKKRAKMSKLLALISEISVKSEVDLILQGGTLLGYIRHGGLIPWDDDVDLGLEEMFLDIFLKNISENESLCYDRFIEPRTNKPYYKIWFANGRKIRGYEYSFPFVDVWLYNIINLDLVFLNGIICPNSASQDFIEVLFEGSKFKIPFNSIECLNTRYKDWQTKVRVYPWSHQSESMEFYPLETKIRVGDNGKLIDFVYKLV